MSFPDPIFETLLLRLANALEIAQKESTTNPQARQALYQATTDFKNALARAKEIAGSLPGGELLISEQNSIITMLESLRDAKQAHLSQFLSQDLSSGNATNAEMTNMEIDSTASSPHD